MGNEAQTTVVRETEASDVGSETFGSITIQPRDLRPFIFRRWSCTVISAIWSPDDPSFGAYHLRARSKEKLVAMGVRKLWRNALRLGIRAPRVAVIDGDGLSSVGVWQAGHVEEAVR